MLTLLIVIVTNYNSANKDKIKLQGVLHEEIPTNTYQKHCWKIRNHWVYWDREVMSDKTTPSKIGDVIYVNKGTKDAWITDMDTAPHLTVQTMNK